MKKFNEVSIVVLTITFAFGLVGPIAALAATAPTLGAADGYSVYGDAGVTNNAGGVTHVWGNVGHNNLGATNLDDVTQVDGVINAGAGVASAASSAFDALAVWGANGSKNLNTNPQTVTPGVWTVDATETLTGDITLSGAGVYIFRSDSAYHVANSARVLLTNGATACNVFWRVPSTMTIGTDAQVVGTIITGTEAITLNTGATLQGRALSLVAAVTLLSNQITAPTCAAVVTTTGGSDKKTPPEPPTLTVIKHVINDNGGTEIASDFSISIKIYGRDVAGSPAFGQESGRIYQLTETGTSTVSEIPVAGYASTFSGDCNSKGEVFMDFGYKKTCTITNNDIALVPPLINITKIPTPLALPGGSGSVTYDYVVSNLGVVGILNVKVTDNKCANVNYISGDINNNSRLGVLETWKYRCTTTLATTTTNIVTATGQANGFTAVDTAEATVVVGLPLTPPLIHVVKKPSVFLLPVSGGSVTYMYTVTNPGMVPLNDVSITDDKCIGLPGRVVGHPGDLNKNNLLESNEAWSFTCQTYLTKTTTNIGTAVGHANGFTAVDISPATVVVTSPKLPNAGIGPDEKNISRSITVLASIFLASIFFYFARRKQTN